MLSIPHQVNQLNYDSAVYHLEQSDDKQTYMMLPASTAQFPMNFYRKKTETSWTNQTNRTYSFWHLPMYKIWVLAVLAGLKYLQFLKCSDCCRELFAWNMYRGTMKRRISQIGTRGEVFLKFFSQTTSKTEIYIVYHILPRYWHKHDARQRALWCGVDLEQYPTGVAFFGNDHGWTN